MTNRSQFRKLNLFLVLTLLACILFSGHLVVAERISSEAILEIGSIVNAKMKALAIRTDPEHEGESLSIKAIRMATSLPVNFVPSESNTVSSLQSIYPIYIFFDNTDDAGIMYFYTIANTIEMNPYSTNLFYKCEALVDISGIANWDTSNVKNMNGLFFGAKSLPDALAIRNWDTSNVVDMSYMFSGATSLMFVDVSNWNTENVKNMSCMFQVGKSYAGDGQLKEIIGLNNLDVSNVTDMTCMFYGAGQMTYYDIGDWNVTKVESFNHMFCDNHSLRSLDLSDWDVSSVKTICDMFDDCYELRTIGDVSRWNTASLIDASGWLNGASSFIGNNEGILDLSGWNTTHLKAAGEMFRDIKVHKIDLSGWTFDSITNDIWDGVGYGIYYETENSSERHRGFGLMFYETPQLTTVYLSKSGLDSFNKAVEREVNTLEMWLGSKSKSFTAK